ncbi:CaiB/BaiF CoA transferase family protein [Tsuneonella amylolytica]|uniref:CaiB/BaiF CoA transferase family protein n=1 Tax=Tsuneonella amylolytica TaxID=2338327 RepID=UPI001F3532E4|nr:CoA transferase [Tsuneonella amylolytica]
MIGPSDGMAMLSGLKVVDQTSVVFGPYCTQILGDFGAEVVKVEPPTGDGFRHAGRPAKTPGMGPQHIALNRNKKSLALDLKDDDAKATLRGLLADADIYVHNVRGAAIERLGFGYEAVKAINPAIIYVHCVGFGSNGPYAGLQAYDDVIQALTGTTNLLGRVDGDPRPRYLPSLIADKVAGLHAAYATMAAIVHRLRTGEGQFVEVPMFEAFANFMLKEHLAGLTFDPPVGDACYARQVDPHRQPFPTKDGWVSIVPYRPGHAQQVIAALGDPAFAADERFATLEGAMAQLPLLYARIGELTADKNSADVVAIMHSINMPAMPVRDVGEVPADPHLQGAGFFFRTEHPTEGTVLQMREPSRFSAWDGGEPAPAPTIGQHNAEFSR